MGPSSAQTDFDCGKTLAVACLRQHDELLALDGAMQGYFFLSVQSNLFAGCSLNLCLNFGLKHSASRIED